ncbi:MAG: GAF domain-containing protein [Gammaproteobacteria bacterium SHHR-1]
MSSAFVQACEHEQLHLSGAIQPHGCLIALDGQGQVSHVSANLGEFLPLQAEQLLGQPLPDYLAAPLDALGMTAGSRNGGEINPPGLDQGLDAIAWRGGEGQVILELTARQLAPAGVPSAAQVPLEPPPEDRPGLAQARQNITERIMQLSGCQRVLYYAFRADGDGEVLAESHLPEAYGSYLGLRFPASDIPMVARNLYLKNPWRQIPDARAESTPLLSRDQAPLDLSWSDLRSVSPMHATYLSNMGVRASLSFPLVVGNGLSGLIAAHHRQPRQLSLPLLEHCAARVRAHALALGAFQSKNRMMLVDSLTRRLQEPRDILMRHGDIRSAWEELAPWLIEQFRTDGAMLCVQDEVYHSGEGFEPEALHAFDHWYLDHPKEYVYLEQSLSRAIPGFPLSEVAGVLAIAVPRSGGAPLRLYLTRKQFIHEVAWGGRPDKPEEFHDGQLGISPRRSFEKWVEKRMGYCREWDNEARLMALKLREALLR